MFVNQIPTQILFIKPVAKFNKSKIEKNSFYYHFILSTKGIFLNKSKYLDSVRIVKL